MFVEGRKGSGWLGGNLFKYGNANFHCSRAAIYNVFQLQVPRLHPTDCPGRISRQQLTQLNNIDHMDAYILSNSPDLSALLARMNITDDNRANVVTPISSPGLAYNQQRRRMRQGSDSASQTPFSPTDGSDSLADDSSYGDSSFERSIANLTFEEIAVLSGKEIVEISTDEDSGESPQFFHSTIILKHFPLRDGEGGSSPSRSTSPTIMAMEFSRNPVTHARRVVLVESCNPNGKPCSSSSLRRG